MRKSKFTPVQRLDILAQANAGTPVSDLCRQHQISATTFYKCKKLQSDDADESKRRIKELETENARLKKDVRRAKLRSRYSFRRLRDAKKWQAQDASRT